MHNVMFYLYTLKYAQCYVLLVHPVVCTHPEVCYVVLVHPEQCYVLLVHPDVYVLLVYPV